MSATVVVLTEDQVNEIAEQAALRALALAREAEPNGWMTTPEAADYLGVHRDTIKRAALRGELRSEQHVPGGRRYYRRSWLDEWRGGRR